MEEVRRPDDTELCGHVERRGARWRALTVFGAVLGEHTRREAAVDQVLNDGLASLSERWTLRHPETGTEEVVCIQEVNAARVTLARGYYAMPGVPTLTITAEQIHTGVWEMQPMG